MLSLPALASKKTALSTSETALADALDPPMGAVSPQGESEQKGKQEQKPEQKREQAPPDWLTAQRKAIGTARPKKPRSAYQRRWR